MGRIVRSAALIVLAVLVPVKPCSAGTVPYAYVQSFLSTSPGLLGATHAGDGSGRLFLTFQDGKVRIWDGSNVLPTPFLDLPCPGFITCDGERGLLSIAFHPSYETNGFFYVYYTDVNGEITVARYQVSAADPNRADPNGVVLLTIPHPVYTNHNGGQLQFGPDGYLYIGTGDGGGAGDPFENAESLGSLLGKILRIDVNGAFPYAIPPTNPFVGTPGARPEIWAYGLRNPWRFSFDRLTGDLFIGDVGQWFREEVNFEPAGTGGRNYGWDRMEGTLCYEPSTDCDDGSLTLPILEYPHESDLCSINGGYRHRGALFPDINGVYFYSDYCQGVIWAAIENGAGSWSSSMVLGEGGSINFTSFGEDEAGTIYISQISGRLWRIVGDGDLYLPYFHGQPQVAQAGAQVTYGIGVENSASTTASAVSANFDLPPGFLFESGNPGCQEASGTVVCPLGDLFSQGAAYAGIVVRMPQAAGTFTVAAHVSSNSPDSDPGNNLKTVSTTVFLPSLSVSDVAVGEGDFDNVNALFTVSLSPAPNTPVTVGYSTANGMASAGADYFQVAGTLSFSPSSTGSSVTVPVFGDVTLEADEDFHLVLSAPVGAAIADGDGRGVILDDDAPRNELVHGSVQRRSLQALSGPQAKVDRFSLAQAPRSSYEIVVDAGSGDLGPDGPAVWRVDGYGTGVLQTATPVSGGTSLSLRWENASAVGQPQEYVLVKSQGCTTDCGPETTYRLRARETTCSIARYNNSGSQVTVLAIQNTSEEPVAGSIWFWSAVGSLAGSQAFSMPAHGAFLLDTSAVAAVSGTQGSITISSDAPYGTLAGKATSLELGTGLTFETPLQPRP